MSELYIPQNIKIGYQQRTDALTGLLAYLIPEDEKGKYNQMLSWQRWRNHELGDAVIDNKPRNGYIINVSKTHVPFSSFGQERTKVRVHSPEGYEFEISVENLIEILEVSDISKKYINAECVFAWQNKQIWLIPINTKIYENYVKAQQEKMENSHLKKAVTTKSVAEKLAEKKRKEIEKNLNVGDVIGATFGNRKYMYVGKVKTYLKGKLARVKIEDIDCESKTLKVEPVMVPLLIQTNNRSKKDILNNRVLNHDMHSENYVFSFNYYLNFNSYVEGKMSETEKARLQELYAEPIMECGKKPLKYVIEPSNIYHYGTEESSMKEVWKTFVKKMVMGKVSKVEKAFFVKNDMYLLRIEAKKYIPATIKSVEKFAVVMELVEPKTQNVLKRVECEIDEGSFLNKLGYVLSPVKGWNSNYQMFVKSWDENGKESPTKHRVEIRPTWYA